MVYQVCECCGRAGYNKIMKKCPKGYSVCVDCIEDLDKGIQPCQMLGECIVEVKQEIKKELEVL